MMSSLPEVESRPSKRATVGGNCTNVIVFGMSGVGKSQFLNALANNRGQPYEVHFASGTGAAGFTNELSSKRITLQTDNHRYFVNLTDSMGCPDPNTEVARKFYDLVVAECNKPQNALVWVVKSDRSNHAVYGQMRVLFRQFNKAKPPLIVVVNGFQNYSDEKYDAMPPDELEALKDSDRKKHDVIGQEAAAAAGLVPMAIISGADIRDLGGHVKNCLGRQLCGTTPKVSHLKTCNDLEAEMNQATTKAQQIAYEAAQAKAADDKAAENKKEMRKSEEKFKNLAAGAAATAVGVQFIPFAGFAMSAAAIALSAHFASRAAEAADNVRRLQAQCDRTANTLVSTNARAASSRSAEQKAVNTFRECEAVLKGLK